MTEEQDQMPQTRVFWVALTAFGGIFTTGIVTVLEHPLFGLTFTVAGLIGLAVLIRDRIQAIPVRTPLLVLLSVMGSLLIGYFSYQLIAISRDINSYVIPRKVSDQQTEDIRAYLAQHEAHAITVKVNPLDGEAREYWGQISNALKGTSWDVELITASSEPYTLNDGLCIHEQGINSKPKDPKHDPRALLQGAFENAHIDLNCGGSVGAGDYKLFLLVGHRPLIVGWQPPLLSKVGRWLMSLSQ